MAKLIVSILSSLDGYCAGPGGSLAGLPMDDAFSVHNLDCMRRAGTLLFGATTFPMFEAYWPNVDRGPGSDPVQREIAERVAAARKLLVSDRSRGFIRGVARVGPRLLMLLDLAKVIGEESLHDDSDHILDDHDAGRRALPS